MPVLFDNTECNPVIFTRYLISYNFNFYLTKNFVLSKLRGPQGSDGMQVPIITESAVQQLPIV